MNFKFHLLIHFDILHNIIFASLLNFDFLVFNYESNQFFEFIKKYFQQIIKHCMKSTTYLSFKIKNNFINKQKYGN